MTKGKPRCPLCGEELCLDYVFALNDIERHDLKWYYYCKCGLWFPLMDTPEEALSTAQKRWQEPNRVLTMNELREHCKQGADAAPLWVEFSGFPRASRWTVADQPDEVFCTDTVRNYCMSYVSAYKKSWRCWLRKPTQEEMEAVLWEGEHAEN